MVAAAETLFSKVHVIGTRFFDECFLFYVITKSYYFSEMFNVTVKFCCVLWSQCFQGSPCFMRYLHNNSIC